MCGVPIRLAFFLVIKHNYVVVMVKDEYNGSKKEYRLKACVWRAHQISVFLGN